MALHIEPPAKWTISRIAKDDADVQAAPLQLSVGGQCGCRRNVTAERAVQTWGVCFKRDSSFRKLGGGYPW